MKNQGRNYFTFLISVLSPLFCLGLTVETIEPNGNLALDCKTQKVFDAGYTVQVTESEGQYFGRVVEIFGWSADQVRFSGPVYIDVQNSSQVPRNCSVNIYSEASGETPSVEMNFVFSGEGAINRLNGELVGHRFGTLRCRASADFTKKFGECFH